MRSRKIAAVVAVAAAVVAAGASSRAQVDPAERAYREACDRLVCQCGCNLALSTCAMDGCHSATPMREEIRERVEKGESVDAIVASFVDRYGILILSAPPAEGFHLSAWIMPFVALVVGLFVVKAVLASWRRSPAAATARAGDGSVESPMNEELRRRIEKELGELES